MSDYLDANRGAVPPMAGSANHSPQNLDGSGAVEVSNSKPFSKDRMHILSVGAVPLRVMFSATGGGTNVVPAAGGAIIPANTLFTFRALLGALYVYVEAAVPADGAFTASVWQRET